MYPKTFNLKIAYMDMLKYLPEVKHLLVDDINGNN